MAFLLCTRRIVQLHARSRRRISIYCTGTIGPTENVEKQMENVRKPLKKPSTEDYTKAFEKLKDAYGYLPPSEEKSQMLLKRLAKCQVDEHFLRKESIHLGLELIDAERRLLIFAVCSRIEKLAGILLWPDTTSIEKPKSTKETFRIVLTSTDKAFLEDDYVRGFRKLFNDSKVPLEVFLHIISCIHEELSENFPHNIRYPRKVGSVDVTHMLSDLGLTTEPMAVESVLVILEPIPQIPLPIVVNNKC